MHIRHCTLADVTTTKCTYVCRNNNELITETGNRAACAIVTGVVATLLQRFPNYTPYQIREQLIKESTKDVINFHTRNGQNLSSIIAETTSNRFAYTKRCVNSKAIINVHAMHYIYHKLYVIT